MVAAVRAMSAAAEVDAVLVQHPTPAHIDYEAALGELDPDKDADGQHPVNMGRLALGMPGPAAVHPGRASRRCSPTTTSRWPAVTS